jgi:NitT/TauT family transport system ATP-binding protein
MDGRKPMVALEGMSIRLAAPGGDLSILEDINLSVGKGDFVVIIGPSGCGKTTLLRVIADLVCPTAGTVCIDAMTPPQARQEGMFAFVFQSATLFPWRTVLDNVCLPMDVARYPDKAARRRRALEALARVGLREVHHFYPRQLSGGMQMRVSIARALVMQPRVLLMDEPFGALDEVTREALNEEVHALCRDLGQTVLFVTHSIEEATFLADRIIVLGARPGRIVADVVSALPRKRDAALRETDGYFDMVRRLRHSFRTLAAAQ